MTGENRCSETTGRAGLAVCNSQCGRSILNQVSTASPLRIMFTSFLPQTATPCYVLQRHPVAVPRCMEQNTRSFLSFHDDDWPQEEHVRLLRTASVLNDMKAYARDGKVDDVVLRRASCVRTLTAHRGGGAFGMASYADTWNAAVLIHLRCGSTTITIFF